MSTNTEPSSPPKFQPAREIWKFPLQLTGAQNVSMLDGARILSVAEQRGQLCMWALVDPLADRVDVEIAIYGTGHLIGTSLDEHEFLGTILTNGGSLVWHVFCKGPVTCSGPGGG